jgi:spermidine/putrescine transport system permease protein
MKRTIAWTYFWLITALLYLPIVLLVIFSFNDSVLLTFPMKGFTLKWYGELFRDAELIKALYNSLLVGFGSSLVATIIGTMAAIGISRHRFIAKEFFLSIASLPLVVPYVVLGVAMLLLFRFIGIPLNLWTVGIGHVVVNIPYVLLIVAARLAGFDAHIEEAAMDLGANYWQTLLRVTLPISAPALLASFLSSFSTSFDEFALTFFLIGTDNTLPIYLYSQMRFPSRLPLVIALAAVIIFATLVTVIVLEWLRHLDQPRRRRKRLEIL